MMKQRCQKAMKKIEDKTNVVQFVFFTSVLNILKSVGLNALLFAVGVCIGYVCAYAKVHYYATTHSGYEYVQKLEKHIKHFREMDADYEKNQRALQDVIDEMKMKMSHEQHHECESHVGKVLWK